MKCVNCGSTRTVNDRSLGGRLVCSRCGSTSLTRNWAPSLNAGGIRDQIVSASLKRPLVSGLVVIAAVFLGGPMVAEGTLSNCNALEKKVIPLLMKNPQMSGFLGYGMLLSQYSGGQLAEAALTATGNKSPSLIACPALYWKYQLQPLSLQKDIQDALKRFGIVPQN